MGVFLLIVGLVLFICLIITHELGHFWLARRNGVEIEEFGIFFPPTLYRHKTKGGWDFTINLLPLGGFVKLKGEHDSDTEKGSFGAASLRAKSKIMIAGIAVNLVTAFLMFTLLAFIGMPHLVDNQFTVASDARYDSRSTLHTTVVSIERGSPAAAVDLKTNDDITAIGPVGGQPKDISITDNLAALTKRYAGQKVIVVFTRSGELERITVQLRTQAQVTTAAKQGQQIGYLGVGTSPWQDGLTVVRSTWSAPIVAAGTMGQLTGLTFEGLGKALAGLGGTIAGGVTDNKVARQEAQTEASSQVSGPIGIFFVLKYGAALGARFILMVVAVLALTLGVMNLLPIPALDGGRLWLTLFMHAIKKPLNARREELINATGFAVLLGLIILVSIVDVKRFL
ncbi:MAG TPA: M50 family metallopeptidase [Verrucomicrobiae bacterium]|nr:M50 family metallopeptidase [Verrucomicrobiae bacterium]